MLVSVLVPNGRIGCCIGCCDVESCGGCDDTEGGSGVDVDVVERKRDLVVMRRFVLKTDDAIDA